MPYIGNSPGTGTRNRYIYTATASQTTFSGADDNGKTLAYSDGDYVDVFLNGICLVPVDDYTATSKTSIVLTVGAAVDDILEVVAYDIATIADTVSKANGGTFNGDLGITSASPDITFTNSTSEDTDGGRESKITFKGKQSGGEESTLAQIQASHDGTADDEKGDLIFSTNDGSDGNTPTEAMRIDANQNVGIGTSPSTDWRTAFDLTAAQVGLSGCLFNLDVSTSDRRCMVTSNAILNSSGDFQHILEGHATIYSQQSGTHRWYTAASASAGATASANERMRIDSDGNLLVANTTAASTDTGHIFAPTGIAFHVRDGGIPLVVDRLTSDGDILLFRKDGTTVGSIGAYSSDLVLATGGDCGLRLNYTSATGADNISPCRNTGALRDNAIDLGKSSARFDDIYATNGSIQTSDQNEKQQIASLTDAEITAAKAISKLFKTFKWNDSVAEKGDAARTHTGVIAQEVEQAMTDAGLNAGDYAFFISTTWWETQTEVPAVEADEENGVEAQEAYTRTDTYETAEEAPEGATERNRKGIRYPQLLSFIGAATEQRLASIESRLDALEAN